MDEPRTFTLAEAAEATGLSVDALRHRIRRGKLRAFRGNDGMVRLRLDAATLDALRAAGRATEPLAETDSQLHSPPDSGLADTLRDALDREQNALRDAAEARERAARARGAAEALRAALDAAEARADTSRAGSHPVGRPAGLMHVRGSLR